jgi:hypothetical protein
MLIKWFGHVGIWFKIGWQFDVFLKILVERANFFLKFLAKLKII